MINRIKLNKQISIILGILFISSIGYLLFKKYPVKSSEMPKQHWKTSQGSVPVQADLVVEDFAMGRGKEVKKGDTITIHYKGMLANGTTFDSSYTSGKPFQTQIGVGKVIRGWDEGVIGMKVGGKRRLTIPPLLAYGSQAVGPIPANSVLIFELELLDIK